MPMKAPSIRACGCVVASSERCEHMIAADKERKARHDRHRPTARQRGYDLRWQKARADFLRVSPTCRRCGSPATVVDHIEPHKGNHALFWNPANWQPLCTACHSGAKQAAERRTS